MITPAVVYFTWLPPASGFQWVSAQAVTDDWSLDENKPLVLVANGFPMLLKGYGRTDGEYEPFKDATGLFRELAAVDPVPDAIMAFADQYGPLTRGQLYAPVDSKPEQFPKPPATCKLAYSRLRPNSPEGHEAVEWEGHWLLRGAVAGDSFATWHDNIRRLKALTALWDAITQRKTAGMEKYAHLTTRGKKQVIVLQDEAGELEKPIYFEDNKVTLRVAAEHALIRAIAGRLKYANAVTLYPPDSHHSRNLAIVPHSLEDAIWLQFGLAVIEDKRFGHCDVCGKPFEISPQVARTNRKLCGPACKARAHRKRREQALRLAERGLKVPEIAKKVGSQVSTVKKWLAARKE